MRPQADEVEFLYELLDVTGHASLVFMLCLNYFNVTHIPPTAMLLCGLLVISARLGAQVCV
jgi:hypothetical protein